jgi:hypothetical protein
MSKSCCSRVRGLMPLRRRCQASWEAAAPPARRELDASWALSQATSAGEVVTGAGEAVVVVVVTVVVVWVEGGEQAQRCAEVAEEDGESEGRMRKTSSAAEDSSSSSAGTVISRSRAAEALDGSAIGGGMDRKIGISSRPLLLPGLVPPRPPTQNEGLI